MLFGLKDLIFKKLYYIIFKKVNFIEIFTKYSLLRSN